MAWLYQPSERQALGDVAKLAVALRLGRVPAEFLDEGFAEVTLGTVGRVLLLSPAELGLPALGRRFALARGTTRLCLAEIVATPAGDEAARDHLAAVEAQRQRSEGRAVVGWLLAPTVTASARALLLHAGAVATSLTPAQ